MKERILLDTNILIYILDDNILDDKVAKLTKILYDSDKYSIVVHPRTLDEANKIKDKKRKAIFKSKLSLYNIIDNPPQMNEEFNLTVGIKNEHDEIDNEMLYALKNNCVSYFITNDKKLYKKGINIGLKGRVLSIDDALDKFKEEEKVIINTPVFIIKEYLYNINLEDDFFASLKNDYKDFEGWFIDKQRKGAQAYITRNEENRITSFLMLKEEGQDENYLEFVKPFKPAKRLKVSTFKVNDTGKKIGECFIKIMVNEAIEKQDVFIIPIQPKYHKLLFEDAENEFQISIHDMKGMNTSANAIKKAFISNSKRKDIKPKDILLFYASQDKKAITTLGIVEAIWNKFDSKEEISNLVRKRTAYTENELYKITKLDSLVIMFKHYITFNKFISYEFLLDNGIVNGYIQAPIKISKDSLNKIVKESDTIDMFK